MIERDYILRMVQQLAAFLARIMLHKSIGQVEQMAVEIDKALNEWLRLDRASLYDCCDEQLVTHLHTLNGEMAHKCLVLATLLQAEAESDLSENTPSVSTLMLYAKALLFYMRAFKEEPDLFSIETAQNADKIVAVVVKWIAFNAMSDVLLRALWHYYELQGAYDQAENVLFVLAERDAAVISEEGRAFYDRLVKKSEDELLRGNLPRDEVEQGLRDFQHIVKDKL